jgi:hypothetical protein
LVRQVRGPAPKPPKAPKGGAALVRTVYPARFRDPVRKGYPPGDLTPKASSIRRRIMKTILAIACLSALALASPVEAKGCIKGAIVGGVAGHMADTASSAPRRDA